MNRRKALFLTLLAGGLAPGRLLAQSRKGRDDEEPTTRRAKATPKRGARPRDDEDVPAEGGADEPPANFPAQVGHQWRTWDIGRYTALAQDTKREPQAALIEWIFRRTGSSEWHGDKIAVLVANRAKLRAYHDPKVLDQVAEVVERFTDAEADVLKVRVRFVAAESPKWRYAVNSMLTPMIRGPQGQQVWTVSNADSALILAQMGINQGGKPLTDETIKMVNGQTLTIETTEDRDYVAGLQRTSAVGLGYQPGSEKLKEGVVLRLSPLLTYEGTAIDAAVDLRANVVRSLHHVRVIAPREIGPAEMTLDVPEVSETRLNQTIKGWPLGQTLVISAGILPGILQAKSGPLNLKIPGTYPTATELLAFINAEVVDVPPRQARGRDRDRERD
jgi:hypothetical protein